MREAKAFEAFLHQTIYKAPVSDGEGDFGLMVAAPLPLCHADPILCSRINAYKPTPI